MLDELCVFYLRTVTGTLNASAAPFIFIVAAAKLIYNLEFLR
ncbi:hypothetical protein [Campylobacter sp.]|nr:hypothetical protein [Campylobacter sp.]